MKRLFVALVALLLSVQVFAQSGLPHDYAAGGGANLNLTAGTVNCQLSGTSGCTIVPNTLFGITGTTTNDSANAGAVGEFATTTVATGAAVALSTGTAADVATVSLTPGDWDVQFTIQHKPAASTSYTILSCSLSATAATMGTQTGGSGIGTDGLIVLTAPATVPAANVSQVSGPVRVSLTATTTIRAVCNDTFSVSTMAAFGTIRARRVR